MAINLKTGVTVGREGEEIAAVFTRKSLKEHDAKVRADAIEEYKASLIEAYNRTDLRERGIYFDNIIYMMANALIKEK